MVRTDDSCSRKTFYFRRVHYQPVRCDDIQLLAGALRLGGSHLSQNPDTLSYDLLGRLLHHYNDPGDDDDDNNNAQVDDEDDDIGIKSHSPGGASIRTLLQQCDSVAALRHSALLPVLQCFDPPTAMSLYILEGHSQVQF